MFKDAVPIKISVIIKHNEEHNDLIQAYFLEGSDYNKNTAMSSFG